MRQRLGDVLTEKLHADGGSGVATFEGEFGDAALVEASEAECDHAVELLFGRTGERQRQALLGAEHPGDGRVFGGVGTEK